MASNAAKIHGNDGVTNKPNPHLGSTFESWLDGKGLREDVTASAVKAVVAQQIDADGAIKRGGANRFADLGYADADERQTQLRLAHAINQVIASKRLSQTQAASRLGVGQPKISALANYKLEGFSVERLMNFLTVLDQDMEITIKKRGRSRGEGRIVVVAE